MRVDKYFSFNQAPLVHKEVLPFPLRLFLFFLVLDSSFKFVSLLLLRYIHHLFLHVRLPEPLVVLVL